MCIYSLCECPSRPHSPSTINVHHHIPSFSAFRIAQWVAAYFGSGIVMFCDTRTKAERTFRKIRSCWRGEHRLRRSCFALTVAVPFYAGAFIKFGLESMYSYTSCSFIIIPAHEQYQRQIHAVVAVPVIACLFCSLPSLHFISSVCVLFCCFYCLLFGHSEESIVPNYQHGMA